MAGFNFSDLQSDVLALLFSFMIIENEDFSTFVKLLMAWVTKRTTGRIKDVLEKLDWDALYQFHQYPFEVARDQFHGFIGFAVRNKVDQAMFYDSIRNLFLRKRIQHHIDVLKSLSDNHFPSSFSYIFFKAVYRPFEREQTALEMFELLNKRHLRGRLSEIIDLLEDMYIYISEKDYLLPVYKFCPSARNSDPIYQLEGHPLGEELWYSLCDKTVQEDYHTNDKTYGTYGKRITMAHMWETKCPRCQLQILLFRILLSSVCKQ